MRFDDLREGAAWLGVWLRDCARSLPRGTLAASAFVGGGIVFGLLAMLEASFDRPVPGGEDSAGPARIEIARLPRPRPDEPLATGSIDRAMPAEPAPPTLLESPSDAADAEELNRKAVETAGSFSECDRVTASRALQIGGLDLVRIDCANGFGVYLDRATIAARHAIVPPAPVAVARAPAEPEPARAPPLTDAEVLQRCEDQVRNGLPYPSSLGRIAASTSIYRAGPGETVVTFSFNTLSGLRFPLSQSAYCVFSDRKLARSEIMPMPF